MPTSFARLVPYLLAAVVALVAALFLPDGGLTLERAAVTAAIGILVIVVSLHWEFRQELDGSSSAHRRRLLLGRWLLSRVRRGDARATGGWAGLQFQIEAYPYTGARAPRLVARGGSNISCLRTPPPVQVFRNADEKTKSELRAHTPDYVEVEFESTEKHYLEPLADLSRLS